MNARSYHLVEVVGTSAVDFKDAIDNAIQEVSSNHSHLDWFEVIEQRGFIKDNKIAYYQAHLKIGLRPV